MVKALVWVEHDNAACKDATLSAVTAAAKLGEVHPGGGQRLRRGGRGGGEDRVAKVHLADDAAYAHGLAENVAPLIVDLMAITMLSWRGHHHGKNIARAWRLCWMWRSFEIIAVEGPKPSSARSMRATPSPRWNERRQAGDHRARHRFCQGGGGRRQRPGRGIAGKGDAGLSSFVSAEVARASAPN
jgi:electron transfer flavoprotein alpha subunit